MLIAATQEGRAGSIDYVVCGLSRSLDCVASLLRPQPCLVRYCNAGAAMTALRAE